MKQQGIYKIRNVTNGKFYIGSSNNIKKRFAAHRRMLRGNRHHCAHLQAAWNKYGEDCFRFEIVAHVLVEEDLYTAENGWLRANVGKPHCYNTGTSAEAPARGLFGELAHRFGIAVPQEHRDKISASLKQHYAGVPENHPRFGATLSSESRARISASRKGKMAGADHYRFGKTVSPEVRAKIGDTQRGVPKGPGRTISEEGKAKIALAAAAGHYSHWKGRKHSAETVANMRRAIVAILPDRSARRFLGLVNMRDELGVTMATIIRACVTGKPIKTGACCGWTLSYADEKKNEAPAIPEAFMSLPRTRSAAQAIGAPRYFTGLPCEHGHIAPRKTKGVCVECAKIDGEKSNEKKRLAKQAN